MAYIGQTSNPLHKRINLHRSNVNKLQIHDLSDTSINYEYQHFHKHGFNNIKIKILNIETNSKKRLFIENQLIKSNNTSYPFGLNQLINNKQIKSITSNKINKHYNPIYFTLNLKKYSKTIRTKRGNKQHNISINKNHIKQEINKLFENYNNNYNWLSVRKYIFAIKKKHLILYLNILNNESYSPQFNILFYDLLIARANILDYNLVQGCTTYGPRAKSGPRSLFRWPATSI